MAGNRKTVAGPKSRGANTPNQRTIASTLKAVGEDLGPGAEYSLDLRGHLVAEQPGPKASVNMLGRPRRIESAHAAMRTAAEEAARQAWADSMLAAMVGAGVPIGTAGLAVRYVAYGVGYKHFRVSMDDAKAVSTKDYRVAARALKRASDAISSGWLDPIQEDPHGRTYRVEARIEDNRKVRPRTVVREVKARDSAHAKSIALMPLAAEIALRGKGSIADVRVFQMTECDAGPGNVEGFAEQAAEVRRRLLEEEY